MPGPHFENTPSQKYERIRHFQFTGYSRDDFVYIQERLYADPYPTRVVADRLPPIYEQPFEVTISVLDESHGYPSEKDLAIQPGQLVVWLGGMIYVMGQMPDGTSQTDVYRYPIIQDVPTGGRL